ncbi:MAG: nucleoside hydrolase [Clostridia bacterium]|nr:nucleoside hydrolase [Clostridia bacterium]
MRRIIIDADTGIDDSIAILYALTSENLHVEGITTCFGNSGAGQSAENSIRLIKLSACGYDVPVVMGAECSLEGEYQSAPKHIHGENGIGNVELPESEQKPLDMAAEDFIIKKADELDGELILVTTGRLTNLAKALMKEPKLPCKIKKVVSMGGCLDTHGNVTPYAEANIYGDPRAADMVLRAGFNMILVGLDVTTKTFITAKELSDLDAYCAEKNRPMADYMQKALKHYFGFHSLTEGMTGCCFVHDPLAVLIAEDASLGEYKMLSLGAEYKSEDFRGMLLRDGRYQSTITHHEVAVCTRVDPARAIRRLFGAFQGK